MSALRDAVALSLDDVKRAHLLPGRREQLRESGAVLGGQDEQPDVVEQAGGKSALGGFRARAGRQGGGHAGDPGAVPLERLELEPRDRRSRAKLADRLRVEHEGSQGLHAEVGDGVGDVGHG